MTSLDIISDKSYNEQKINHTMSYQEKSQEVSSGKAVQKEINLICRRIGKEKKKEQNGIPVCRERLHRRYIPVSGIYILVKDAFLLIYICRHTL